MSDTTKVTAHVAAALAVHRNRQPVLRVDSSRTSTRPECLMCGVGIRKETTPVNGMHPRCAKVAADPEAALTMRLNTHAARALRDREYVAARRNNEDLDREAADRAAHAALLARFEASEAALDSAAS